MRSTLGIVAAAAMVLGPALAYLHALPALGGFVVFALGGILALGVAIASLVQAARGRGITSGGALAIGAAAVFVFAAARGAGVPRINDYTTDVADPPRFVHAGTLPANVGRDMSYPPAFAAEQASCCTDLGPVELTVPPAQGLERVEAVARAMPDWEVTVVDAADGRVEAIATSGLFHFEDDVVIRVRPLPDGTSRVDMRSKSRDGKGDLGANAARIRAFTAALQKGQ
jgi:uncharacterized protein (DUF1499 family)